MFGLKEDHIDYWSIIKDKEHWRQGFFSNPNKYPNTYAHVQFSVSQDLVLVNSDSESPWTIVPFVGGWFVCLYLVGALARFLFMPWITYLSLIIRLFRVDPSKGKMPRDPMAIDRTKPWTLVRMAKQRIKARTPITSTRTDLWMLNVEALVRKILTCRTSKFG
jgi:hypothetical protein